MKAPVIMLSERIKVRRRFLRSVNLEKDYQTNGQNGDYIVTPTCRQVLRRVSEALAEESTYRAWTVTGPYGVGKSAFAVFLAKLLCRQVEGSAGAWQHLQKADPGLARELGHRAGNGKGMLPVAITARRAPVALCLTEGVRASLAQVRPSHAKPLLSQCDSLILDVRNGIIADSRRVVSLVESLTSAAERAGYSGLLFMTDELGKLFEFAARMPQKSDVFVLQELAEHASRSGAFPSLFMGFLHQSFEEYGQHLDSLTGKEWAKVQGRFEDVAFLEPADQVVRMVAAAIEWTGRPLSPELTKGIKSAARASAEAGACPPGMGKAEFENISVRAYPLHPVTLVALPFIFRRFGQNERSLFSYLNSLELHGFQDFLRKHAATGQAPDFLRLSHLFDYFTTNFGSGLFRQPQARRWMEAADVLDRRSDLTPAQAELIKTVGVLCALGEFSHLSAAESVLSAALSDTEKLPAGLQKDLLHLQKQSIIVYRRFNRTYRTWEGSDVDINERVAEGKRQLRGCVGLASGIQQYLPPRPLVARKHNFLSGSLRYFSVTYVDDPTKVAENLTAHNGDAGHVLVCLSSSPSMLQAFCDTAAAIGPQRQHVVFAVPQQMGEIHSAVAELGALRWAWDNTPELRDDRVARREMALRISDAEHFLRHHLGTLLDPRKEPLGSECLLYWDGKLQDVHSRTDISQVLSHICDTVYNKAPWIRNELIVRRALSSAAAAARRNLIERMLTSPSLLNLGMDGYPPERSMYESVLRATGVHHEIAKGVWGFGDPCKGVRHGLSPSWERLRHIIFGGHGEPRPLDSVFRMLAEAPYGVMDGLHPVLLCAFMMAHGDETTLYREDTFIPEPSIADFEVLMRRPELFAIAGSRVLGSRAVIVERLAKGLNTQAATVPIVRALFRMVKPLSEFAWRTKRLSQPTLALRSAFGKAKSPEKFLFTEVPIALGLPALPEGKPQPQVVENFFKALNAALNEWGSVAKAIQSEAKAVLLQACGFKPTDAGWQEFREIATKLEPRESDPVLMQFLRRVVQSGCDESGVAAVLALVVNRPPANWLDSDIDRFPELAAALGEPIQRAMARAALRAEPHRSLIVLTHEQQRKAASLAQKLGKQLKISEQQATPDVLRAALLLLADKLIPAEESDS